MTVPAPNNGTGTETTRYFYDPDERLTKIEWPDGSTQLFAYAADDHQTSFTNEDSAATTTAYDVLGRVAALSQTPISDPHRSSRTRREPPPLAN